jgi:hypothetical protein
MHWRRRRPLGEERRMTSRTITAVYDNEATALQACEQLIGSGVAADDVRIVNKNLSRSDADKSMWESLADLLIIDTDRPLYDESLRRGGYLLTTRVNDEMRDEVISMLDQTGPIDLDERSQQWRTEGWSPDGLGAPASMHGYAPGAGPTTESVAQQLRDQTQARQDQTRDEARREKGGWSRESARGSARVRSYVYNPSSKQ